MSKIYIVDTISALTFQYAVEADSLEEAKTMVGDKIKDQSLHQLQEFSQFHAAETVSGAHKVSEKEYLKEFDVVMDYLSKHDDDFKLSFVNKKAEISVPEL